LECGDRSRLTKLNHKVMSPVALWKNYICRCSCQEGI